MPLIFIQTYKQAVLAAFSNLYMWGSNTNGYLGLNDTINRSSPTVIGGTDSWSVISNGPDFALGLKSNKTLWAWGVNTNGQLGLNDTVSRSSPVQIGASSWLAVSAGTGTAGHSMAVRLDGGLFTWGLNTNGQLGQNDVVDRSSPVQVGTSSWTTVSAGSNHSVAVRVGGLAFGWGLNTDGQVGDNSVVSKSSPVQIGGAITWFSVSAGGNHNAATSSFASIERLLYVWGSNSNGQLGFNQAASVPRSVPTQLSAASSWAVVSCGENFTAGVRSGTGGGTLFTWGLNTNGQLGHTSTVSRSSPIQVGGLTNWLSVEAGNTGMLALDQNGNLHAWGLNTSGAVGDQTAVDRSSPVQIGSDLWGKISQGGNFSAGIQFVAPEEVVTPGALFAWGGNASGSLGLGDAAAKNSPNAVGSLSWKQIVGGNAHAAALRSDDTLWTWGVNTSGQLGQGDTISRSSPVQVGTSSWTMVGAGQVHTIALRIDGTVWTWGSNSVAAAGALGDGTTVDKSSPVQVGGLTDWFYVAAGNGYSLALRAAGALWRWGRNLEGQLGIGTNVGFPTSPVIVDGPVFTKVYAGNLHSAGITADNELFVWGQNNNGQVGNGTVVDPQRNPVLIPGQWSSASLGELSTYAIRTDGSLWSWGSGVNGRLGDNTAVSKSSPVAVVGSASWTQVSAGSGHCHGIQVGGLLWAWGNNATSQLGDGGATTRSSPVQIGADSWIMLGTPQNGIGNNGFGIR